MVRINGLFHLRTYKWGITWGEQFPLIRSLPVRDIQVSWKPYKWRHMGSYFKNGFLWGAHFVSRQKKLQPFHGQRIRRSCEVSTSKGCEASTVGKKQSMGLVYLPTFGCF